MLDENPVEGKAYQSQRTRTAIHGRLGNSTSTSPLTPDATCSTVMFHVSMTSTAPVRPASTVTVVRQGCAPPKKVSR